MSDDPLLEPYIPQDDEFIYLGEEIPRPARELFSLDWPDHFTRSFSAALQALIERDQSSQTGPRFFPDGIGKIEFELKVGTTDAAFSAHITVSGVGSTSENPPEASAI